MSTLSEVKDVIIEAKKKYDKEKYIDVLEQQLDKLQLEIERLNTKISKYEDGKFKLNHDHIVILNQFRKNDYMYYDDELDDFVRNNIDYEIAMSELKENEFICYPSVVAVGARIVLHIPNNKKIEYLQYLKSQN